MSQQWSTLITCPFPSHKNSYERTPSFAYNFVEDRFFCHGCKAFGRAVEFISLKERKGKLTIANSILDHYADSGYIDEPIEEENPKLEELLFSFSKFIRQALHECENEKDVKEIDKISWWFDSYISVKAGSQNGCSFSNINVEELEARVLKAQDLIQKVLKT